MKKIICVIPSLGHGGAQKVIVDIANFIGSHEHDINVQIYTLSGPNFQTVWNPEASVAVHQLGFNKHPLPRLWQVPLTLFRLRKYLIAESPSVILSFQDIANFAVLISLIGKNFPIVVSERLDPKTYHYRQLRRGFRKFLYPRAVKIVCQTRSIASQMPCGLRNNVVVIPNACPTVKGKANTGVSPDEMYRAIAVSRLEKKKGLSELIDAFARIAYRFPRWRINIYGKGREESALKEKIREYELDDNIFLMGTTTNIVAELHQSHLFLFPSKAEGFPNALAEAIACGLPCVANDHVSGVRELVKNGTNGILTSGPGTIKEFSMAMEHLMSNAQLRADMGEQSITIAQNFSKERILKQWSDLLLC